MPEQNRLLNACATPKKIAEKNKNKSRMDTALVMTGNIRACCRGFQDLVIACVYRVFIAALDHSKNEELLCDFHQFLVKYGPVQIRNEVTVALMTPPVHLGSKTSQEADDNHTTALYFGVVQGCHKRRSPNP